MTNATHDTALIQAQTRKEHTNAKRAPSRNHPTAVDLGEVPREPGERIAVFSRGLSSQLRVFVTIICGDPHIRLQLWRRANGTRRPVPGSDCTLKFMDLMDIIGAFQRFCFSRARREYLESLAGPDAESEPLARTLTPEEQKEFEEDCAKFEETLRLRPTWRKLAPSIFPSVASAIVDSPRRSPPSRNKA